MQSKNICATTINSEMSIENKHMVLTDLYTESPKIKLLYVTPEQCLTKTFNDLLHHLVEKNKLSYFVVDEAHCVIQWGNSFRKYYSTLGSSLRKKTGNVTWVALTATASERLVSEIASSLQLKAGYKILKLPCFRNNIFYDVVYKDVRKTEENILNIKTFIEYSFGKEPGCLDNWKGDQNSPCVCVYIYTHV